MLCGAAFRLQPFACFLLTPEFHRHIVFPMAIADAWQRLRDREAIRQVPMRAGVYELADKRKTVVYIGRAKGGNLRNRLRSHANERVNDCVRTHAVYFRYMATKAHRRDEKTLFAEYKAKHRGKIPPCNTIDPSLRR